MNFDIGAFDAAAKQVAVDFRYAGITHSRAVNAVLNDDGEYDAAATEARVAEVANGVKIKIDVGAIGNAPEPVLQEPVEAE